MSEDDRSIEFTVKTTLGEQVAVSRAITLRTVSYWCLLGLFVGAPVLTLLFLSLVRHEEVRVFRTLVPLAAFGLAFWWMFPWLILWTVRRGLEQPDGPYRVAIAEDGVSVDSRDVKVAWKWEAFLRARETARFYLLYLGRNNAQFVPKRVLSPEQEESLRVLLHRHLGTRAALMERP